MTRVDRRSPNHDARALPVSMIVLHCSGARDAEAALARLCDPAARCSAHYLVARDGTTWRLVDEARRAWHAGGDARWRGIDDVDSAAVGIDLVDPGGDWGGRLYPDAQIAAVIRLVHDVKDRHRITRGNVVGQSDVAPAQSRDPGELFPWERLARLRLALPRPTRGLMDPHWNEASFLLALERFGYDVRDARAAIMAFQRRFRPEMVDGEVDAECRMLLLALLLPKPQGGA